MRVVLLEPVDLNGEFMSVGRPHRPLGIPGPSRK
jgi:hypothetical protein